MYEQLQMGVRFLDLRLCKYQKKGGSWTYYCLHTFLTVPLERVMYDICRFMNENPTETVLSIMKPGHFLVHHDSISEMAASL